MRPSAYLNRGRISLKIWVQDCPLRKCVSKEKCLLPNKYDPGYGCYNASSDIGWLSALLSFLPCVIKFLRCLNRTTYAVVLD